MRFIIGQIIHETNAFSNVKTEESMFRLTEWSLGEEIIIAHTEVRDYIGGMLDEACRLDIETVPLFAAAAAPSGIIELNTFHKMKELLLEAIRAAEDYDAVLLALHGAGVADGIEDIEGDILQAVRASVGPAIPIVVTLDLHANVTPLMVEHADVLIGNYLYPHTDSFECGQEAVKLAHRTVLGHIKPVMRLAKPLLLMPTIGTAFYPVNYINDYCYEYERAEGVVDCTFYHGFPYSDVYYAGVGIVVITDGDERLAERIAEELSFKVLQLKESFNAAYPAPAEGIALARQAVQRPVIINETSDNPGAGAPADGTRLLAAMLEQRLQQACFAFIYDPETVEAAHRAGVGAEIDIRLGGKTDQLHGESLQLRAYVKCLTDGEIVTSSPMGRGTFMRYGPSARLKVDGIDIIVCAYRNNQVFDEQLFLLHGIDVRQMNIVALKSSIHFRAVYEQISNSIITVDCPGLSMMDFTEFDFKHVRRPIYPLDIV